MSFAEQERVLFDLLFDRDLRNKFSQDPDNALQEYDLDESEKTDFSVLRTDALQVDANIRVSLVLSHLCRSYPITFSIVSSIQDGIDQLKSLVDVNTMRTPHIDRPVVYGKRLSEKLLQLTSLSIREQQFLTTIMQLELGMAWTAANLKREVIEGKQQPIVTSQLPDDWADRPVRLAEHVVAGLVPLSYKIIKKRLCPVEDSQLWRFLSRTPTSSKKISSLLSREDPRFLISLAQIDTMSFCEPTVTYLTIELSEGFASLFQHINDDSSVISLLQNLKQAGATDQIIKGVKSGFNQLLTNEMLKVR